MLVFARKGSGEAAIMDRRKALLSHFDASSEAGLELGPLDKALVPRAQFPLIRYCDYAPREVLREKSKDDPHVDIDNIPEIDFVAPFLTEHTFGNNKFDYVIASHVIEHVPDVIRWLRLLLAALKPGGRIVLAVPDRRYTFDYFRPPSTVGEMIAATLEGRTCPTFAQTYDAFSKAVRVDSWEVWEYGPQPQSYTPIFSRELAMHLAHGVRDRGEYHDCHCWVFDDLTFPGMIRELCDLGLLDARIAFHTTPAEHSNEFHVVLMAGAQPNPRPLQTHHE
jgi:SAM-dependent methyltransferase